MHKSICQFTIILFLILTAVKLVAADAQEAFANANKAYQFGNFALAAAEYETILTTEKAVSKDVYYNLGNAYFRLNQIGRATLNYERALHLDPSDADTQANLAAVRTRLTDDIEPPTDVFFVRWGRLLRGILSADAWAAFGIFSLMLGTFGFSLWLLSDERRWKKRGFIAGCVAVPLSILLLLLAWSAASTSRNVFAIIMKAETPLRGAPDPNAAAVQNLHEGLKVELTDKIGQLSKIKLSNGEEGWILSTDLEKI